MRIHPAVAIRLLVSLLFVICFALQAHDLQTSVRLDGAFVVVEASYEGEDAASYLAVRIEGPEVTGAPADAYQTGRTDRTGKFVFLPDRPGLWKAIIDDEMGHRATAEVTVPAAASEAPQSASPAAASSARSTVDKLLVGLSLLFGATGFLLAWTSRRRSASAA